MSKAKKYREIPCPFCGAKVKVYVRVGKVTCPGCHEIFYVGYDRLKHAWVSTDSKSPIRALFIQGVRKGKEGKGRSRR